MSVIFEQGSAGRAVWHEVCGPNTARRFSRLARSLRQEPRSDRHRALTLGTELAAPKPQASRAACSKLKYIYHTYREEKNEF